MTISYSGVSEPIASFTVTGLADTFIPIGGTVTLDENYSPRIRASLTIPITDPVQGDLIDPLAGQRITLTIGNARDEFVTPRVLDLGIRDRTVNYAEQTMLIEATSDEMLLHDTGNLSTTTDRTARDHQGSLRAVVNWALGKIGAALEPAVPGSPDPDMTASWDQTNLILNSRAAVDTAGWAPSGNGTVVRAGTSVAPEGASVGNAIEVAITTADRAVLRYEISDALRVSGGMLYTYSCFLFQDSGAAKDGAITLRFENDAGATLQDFNLSQPLPHNQWTKFSITGLAPVNASKFAVYAGVPSGMPAPGKVRATANVLAEGVQNDRWFDGDRPDEPDLYEYAYTPDRGTPSTRTALNPLSPDVYAWEPGQSLFEFLRPLLEASNTRLWCDEQRRWWLDIPRPNDQTDFIEVAATGNVVLGNAVSGSDVISRDRDDYATGVVVKSTWRDANGDRKTKYDVTGVPGKVVLVEREAYPGPGIAATMLAAMKNRGRTQTLTVAGGSYYHASPGWAASVRLPGTADRVMHVRRVEIDIATGNVTVNTTGMETS